MAGALGPGRFNPAMATRKTGDFGLQHLTRTVQKPIGANAVTV